MKPKGKQRRLFFFSFSFHFFLHFFFLFIHKLLHFSLLFIYSRAPYLHFFNICIFFSLYLFRFAFFVALLLHPQKEERYGMRTDGGREKNRRKRYIRKRNQTKVEVSLLRQKTKLYCKQDTPDTRTFFLLSPFNR